MKAEKFTLVKRFDGFPTESNFQLDSEELPQLAENEILCESLFLSVDPYMRPFTASMEPPFTMIGSQVAKVLESKSKDFPKDCIVVGYFGWRTLTVLNPESDGGLFRIRQLPDLEGLPLSYGLGACGMPGNTAYLGLLDLCRPKPGETVVVTAAAGAVGSLVGQIAKIKGCHVVGIAGSDAKCDWIKSLGFDAAINYKTCEDLDNALGLAAPNGIDCYFDNVGGVISHKIRMKMNNFGRVAVCGSISQYNSKTGEETTVPSPELNIIFKQLSVHGFIVSRWEHDEKWLEAIKQMVKWIKEGKIKVQETVTEGFTKMPQAFMGLFSGENTGKAIVKM